ncbi:Alpha/beta hydrolase family protein [Legionella massiliensis]|uniref:Alpha/beta hydrolase family protein n=1 Tax=Legionella massiliensis TaxID=1034943 RepID=A0A078L6E0_9GAMM|nr:alpha/beta fold hydrolase [Legionella massiliensis]CDZ79463.1 Alpha/beta hydrolase family protein [Legionella massiliensis]CEE15201.1 Alpha/beta hydrolase family protein [Legionella massiliensis]
MCYEQIIADMQADAAELECNVVGFNLRGVGNSTGHPQSKQDLVNDGIAQIQRLLDAGVSAENITLKGHSLGGGISTLVADHFHKQGYKVNLFNGRSFSSLTNFVVGQIRTGSSETGHEETFGGKLLGWLAKPFVSFAVRLVKWEMDADDAFKAIPAEYKEYMLARTRREMRTAEVLDDPVIPHYASLHAALKTERQIQKDNLDDVIATAPNATRDAAKKARASYQDRKMENDNPRGHGHVTPMDNLHSRSGKTATTFFREFVGRAHSEHGNKPAVDNPSLI